MTMAIDRATWIVSLMEANHELDGSPNHWGERYRWNRDRIVDRVAQALEYERNIALDEVIDLFNPKNLHITDKGVRFAESMHIAIADKIRALKSKEPA